MQYFPGVDTKAGTFHQSLESIKSQHPDVLWYPYGTLLGNIMHFRSIIDEEVDGLFSGGKRFADIGAGDGNLAFYLESLGNSCDIYDCAGTPGERRQPAKEREMVERRWEDVAGLSAMEGWRLPVLRLSRGERAARGLSAGRPPCR